MNRPVPCSPRNVPRLGRRALVQLLDSLVTVHGDGDVGEVSLRCSSPYLRSIVLEIRDDPARPRRVRIAAGECLGKTEGRGEPFHLGRSWVALIDALREDEISDVSPAIDADRFVPASVPVVLYLPELRSPFNAGNILRTAAAFGIAGVVLGSAGPSEHHPRFLRAAMGAERMVPLHRGDLETCRLLLDGPSHICALESPGRPLGELKLVEPMVFMLGHEQYGLSQERLQAARESGGIWQIPHSGPKSSLNVGVAAGILLHHLINSQG